MRTSLVLMFFLAAVPSAQGTEPGDLVTNSVGMKLAYMPPGTFTMGSPKTEPGRIPNETRREVTFAKGFRIGVTEVTQEEWRRVMETNPSFFKGDDRPVERITWREATEFCRRLSEKEKKRYRLPTQAEWEYACRAGTTTVYSTGGNEAALAAAGWYLGNSGNESHPVGRKKPNPWGLYDMHGNVSEWCADAYAENYVATPRDGSAHEVEDARHRVGRGGGWRHGIETNRSAVRHGYAHRFANDYLGVRPARSVR